MLGPIETLSRSLDALIDLAPIVSSTRAARPLHDARIFAEEVHRIGIATVLDRIAHHSIGVGGSPFETIEGFGDALKGVASPTELTVATLNYDGLTHAALPLNAGAVADLADGRESAVREVVPGNPIGCYRLRERDDFPDDRTHIIQLHGSLAWLREPETAAVWRFTAVAQAERPSGGLSTA